MLLKRKFPYWFIKESHLYRKDSSLEISQNGDTVSMDLSEIGFLLIGNGCQITSNLLSHISRHKGHICFSSSTGVPTAILSTNGNYGTNKWPSIQSKFYNNKNLSFNVSKKILLNKNPELSLRINCSKNKRSLFGIEGSASKKVFKQVYGNKFKREYKNTCHLNTLINIAHNTIYNASYVFCHEYGLSPHLGFLHGAKRNSFIYDLSEIYKNKEMYSLIAGNETIVELHQKLSNHMFETNIFKKMENLINDIFDIDKKTT